MKAIIIDGYGGPDRLQLRDQPDPRPSAGELLVRVRAAGVNPVDSKIRRGDLRLFLHIKFPYIPGGDVSGEVIATGPGVTKFKPGDEVVAFVDMVRGGGYAELAVVKESATALKSPALSFVEAASLPIAAVTALQSLRDLGGLRAGGSALIHGGAGGVGHFAVQIAKALGATAAATCGPSNVEFVQSLGADLVIDYTREQFPRRPERYDVILDAVAKSSFAACRHVLKPGGVYVTTLPSVNVLFWSAAQSAAGLFTQAKRARMVMCRTEGADLASLGELADQGRLKPAIARTFRLEQAADAQVVSEQGHTRGKFVLEVQSASGGDRV
jgi:NADPH:quinone reductase-like Zn-dependent oxidoreductase